MTLDEIMFFDGHSVALPLYEKLKGSILAEVPDTRIEVRKTQISFFTKHMFAAVSFTPVRKAAARPDPFLTVTFGLRCRSTSARIDAAVEPYPCQPLLLGSSGLYTNPHYCSIFRRLDTMCGIVWQTDLRTGRCGL